MIKGTDVLLDYVLPAIFGGILGVAVVHSILKLIVMIMLGAG